MNKTVNKLTAR